MEPGTDQPVVTVFRSRLRDDPEHRSAQQRGRDDFYLEYTISVCPELRRRHFDTNEARGPDGEP